jgi:ketosteroid isomerase-like protein
MSRRLIACGGVALLLCGGCRSRVDVVREADALLATDRAWARGSVAGGDADSLVAFWTDDARVAMAGQPLVHGKVAIREMVKGSMAIPGFRISWTPDSAVVSESGDLGFTFGTNAVTAPDAAGKLSTVAGRYLTVWRKGADGRWRCVMDYSNPGPVQARGA